jgi:hypothetical protein
MQHVLVRNQNLLIETHHDAVLNRHRQGLPPRSPKYLIIHSQSSYPVILNLQSHSFLVQSQIKVLINFLKENQS